MIGEINWYVAITVMLIYNNTVVMMKSNPRERKSLMRSRAMVVAIWKFVRLRKIISPPPGVQLASQRRIIPFKSW